MSNETNAVIVSNEQLTENLFRLKIKPDFTIPDFLPGQYVALGLPCGIEKKLVKRAYSICSSPDEKEYFEFIITKIEDGTVTPRLEMLTEGARIFVAEKIVGQLTLDSVANAKRLLLVATGTGIAPFISMLKTKSTWEIDREVVLILGVRCKEDLIFDSELKALELERENFKYIRTLSRGEDSWQGERGYVQDLMFSKLSLDPEGDHVFLCGNPGMIDVCEQKLLDLGFNQHTKKVSGNLHLEKFW